jgi:GNAT superfamily N-acetyltransferase
VIAEITPYAGPREALRTQFELAEDSPQALASRLDAGRVLVARDVGDDYVGQLRLVPAGEAGAAEIKSMAVRPAYQRRGIGRALVAARVEPAAAERVDTLRVAIAIAIAVQA